MIIKVYKRKSVNYLKFNYHCVDISCYVTPTEMKIMKDEGHEITFVISNNLTPEELNRAILNVVNFWTAEDLKKNPDPELIFKIINKGGYINYIKYLERINEQKENK